MSVRALRRPHVAILAGLLAFPVASASAAGPSCSAVAAPPAQPAPRPPTTTSNVAVTQTAVPDPVAVDGTVSYDMTISTTGPDPATGVVVTERLAPGMVVVSASTGCRAHAGRVACTPPGGVLAVGASASFTVTARPTLAGRLVSRAWVHATSFDPAPSNNVSAAAVISNANPPQCSAPSFAPPRSVPVQNGPDTAAIGDMDNDGKADLVVTDASSDLVSVVRGVGNGTYRSTRNFPAGIIPFGVDLGDFDNDGRADVVVGVHGANEVAILRGDGAGGLGPAQFFAADSNPWGVTVDDFNGDGNDDVAVANFGCQVVSVLLGDGTGNLGPRVDHFVGDAPMSVATGDFDGDGDTDIAAALHDNDAVAVLLGDGFGGFASAVTYAVGSIPKSVKVLDADGDGRLDLVAANHGSSDVSLLAGNGDGTFASAASFGAGSGPREVVVADFDRDGRADLAVTDLGSDEVSILTGNGAGSFAAPQPFATVSGPSGAAAGDLNRDGAPDLVIPGANGRTTDVLLNNCLPADLGVTLTGTPSTSAVGSTISYQAVVTNAGPRVASATTLVLQLPSRVTLVSSSGATCTGTTTLTCALGNLASGAVRNLDVQVVAATSGLAKATASVSAFPVDPNLVNNKASTTTNILASSCTSYFDGGAGDGLWQSAANWSGDTLPGSSDTVCIGEAFDVTLSAGLQSIHHMRNFGSLTMQSGQLVLAAASFVRRPFTMIGGALSGPGSLSLDGGGDWTFGTMDGTGTTIVPVGALFEIDGNVRLAAGRRISNSGLLEWCGGSIDGTSSSIFNLAGGTFVIMGGVNYTAGGGTAMVKNQGTMQKTDAALTTFGPGVSVSNQATLQLQAGRIAFSGGFNQTAGSTALLGGDLAGSTLTFGGGVLSGNGNITGAVQVTAGEVRPGGSPGRIVITGSYTQGASAMLRVDLGGTGAGTTYDVLEVSGSVSLAGTLKVVLIGGFVPSVGDAFRVLTYGSRSGTLTLDVPPFGPGRTLDARYNPTDLTLQTVSIDANLQVALTDAPDPVHRNAPLVYTVSVHNAGPMPATGVVAYAYLPTSVDNVQAPGCSISDRVVSCLLHNVAVGATVVRSITVVPTVAPASLSCGALALGNESDPQPGDSSAVATTSVIP